MNSDHELPPSTPPEHPVDLEQWQRRAQTQGLPRLDAQMLVLLALGRDPHQRAWLLAHGDERPSAAQQALFEDMLRRRLAGEPLAYLMQEKDFYGLRLRVDARVLVPRPDTETLIDWALALPGLALPTQALDLGTGSGAIALALKSQRPAWQLCASDASADALALACSNGEHLGLAVDWRLGHWWAAWAGQRFDLVLSNPPYIAEGDPHLAALTHEPAQALSAGADGLDDLRQIVAGAPAALRPGGWLLLEHGHDQAEAVRVLLQAAGFSAVGSRSDLAGIERCSGGRWDSL